MANLGKCSGMPCAGGAGTAILVRIEEVGNGCRSVVLGASSPKRGISALQGHLLEDVDANVVAEIFEDDALGAIVAVGAIKPRAADTEIIATRVVRVESGTAAERYRATPKAMRRAGNGPAFSIEPRNALIRF